MNNHLAPSRSTVYVSNFPYDLKNNDIHKLFEKYGKIVKVTIVKDKVTRQSKGVAFILFLQKEDAKKCAYETNMKEMFGRTLKASIAIDNGRSTEFVRKRTYPDKTSCYECGETGHLSYACSSNLLGARDPPPKKKRKRKDKAPGDGDDDSNDAGSNNEDEGDYQDDETLSAAIAAEQEKHELDDYRQRVAQGRYDNAEKSTGSGKKIITKSAYFSDEEEIE